MSTGNSQTVSLQEIALLFLKLGTIAFGGPAAHIALMEDEVVRRRRWCSREEFMDLIGATNLIPGPNSTEMAIHIGYRKAGWAGLLIAGCCFIVPSALIVTAFAWAYTRYGGMPQMGAILYGIKPVMIAVVFHALWLLARTALKTRLLTLLSAVAALLNFFGAHELAILAGAGLVCIIGRQRVHSRSARGGFGCIPPVMPFAFFVQTAAVATSLGLWPLFLFFLKTGSVLFGSGYVLLAFLRADLVERWHWLSEAQLLDAIAVGQITPGPVFTTATFIGYVLAGPWGAFIATLGIFLPAFVFVMLSGPLIPRIRRSPTAGAFLDGVNAASLALMAVVTYRLAGAAFVDTATILVGIAGGIALIRFGINASWIVLGGAVVGLLVA